MIVYLDKKEQLKKEIQSLQKGDMVNINGSPRLLRFVKKQNNPTSKYFDQPFHFYFAKKVSSAFPACYTSFCLYQMTSVYGGLIKRGVDLINSKEEAAVQYSIENQLAGVCRKGSHNESAKKYGLYASGYKTAGKFK